VYGSATFSYVDVRYGGAGGVNNTAGAIWVNNLGNVILDFASVRYAQRSGLVTNPCVAATIKRSDLSSNANGISLWESAGCAAKSVLIQEGTTVTNNSSTGIFMNVPTTYAGPPIIITDSDITDNSQYGISLQVSATVVSSQPYGHHNNIVGNGSGADKRQLTSLYHLPADDWTSNYWGDVAEAVPCTWAPANTFHWHLSYEQPNPYTSQPKKGPVSYQTYSRISNNQILYCGADHVMDYPYADEQFDNAVWTLGPLTARLKVRSFIQAQWLPAPDDTRDIFEGDDRSFCEECKTDRVNESVDVFNPLRSATDLVNTGAPNPFISTFLTQRYDWSTSLDQNGVLTQQAIDDWTLGYPMKLAWALSDFSSSSCTVTRFGGNGMHLHCIASASNPLVAFAPAIDTDYTVDLTFYPANIHFVMNGCHDSFPSHEMYINSVTIFNDVDDGNPLSLFEPCGLTVYAQGDIQ
jgi:hypothetical protein